MLGVDGPLLKPIWPSQVLPGARRCLTRRRRGTWGSCPQLSGEDSPGAQICTVQLLQGAWLGGPWVDFLHFQSAGSVCALLRGCPSLRHRGVSGCGSPGWPRPQNHPGLGAGLLWPCRGHVKQQQLLIASDISEHQLASCCMERHRRVAGATAEGCLSPSPLPTWHQGDGPGGGGARRGSGAPGRKSCCGLALPVGSKEGVSSSTGVHRRGQGRVPCLVPVTRPAVGWAPTVGGELGTCWGAVLKHPLQSLALGCSRQRCSAVGVPAGWVMLAGDTHRGVKARRGGQS